jgi:prepilin-type N-terminal cleavage/methylation domain-containing protein
MKLLTSQRGDTLIEVTMALAILSVVLLTSTIVTTRAFRLGQTARERTMIADDAQAQIEALRSFRDNHTWNEFLNGGTIGTSAFNGVLNAAAVGPRACSLSASCFYLALTTFGPGETEFVPSGGSTTGTVPTSYMEVTVTPNVPVAPTSVDIDLSYGFTELGDQTQAIGHIKTTLTDLGL